MSKKIEPPEHLSDRAKEIFRTAITKNSAPGRIAQVTVCLEGLDRLDEIRKELSQQGLFTTSKRSKLKHINPLVKLEAKERAFLLKQWDRIELQCDSKNPFPAWEL